MKILPFVLLCLCTINLLGQESFHCGSDIAMRKYYSQHPGAREIKLEQLKNKSLQLQQKTSTLTASYTIPIVCHILHLGGPENVSDAQVKDAVRILNRDFAKQNPDTTEIIYEFKNLADSARIQFVLASKDPGGNCTNGIIHHYDTDTDWNDNSPTIYSYTWDPTKYMNVYIVRSITLGNGFPAAGYTYYPGSWPSGDPADAIVVLNNYFGSIGTGDNFLSRVLTHETGHWLGLAHVFGYFQTAGIDCSDDDFISDTPPTIGYLSCPNLNQPATYQICNPGLSENYQNYMDYSYCVRMFTQGQCQAMQQTLQDFTSGRDNLVSNTNLIATGVINPGAACVPVADFKFNRKKTCVGVPVTFTDDSWNAVPSSFNWSFPGGTPSASTFSAPVVSYASPGVYAVTYSSANSAGSSAPITKTNIITVSNSSAVYLNNWSEGFENGQGFTNDWLVESSSGAGLWERDNAAANSGVFSAKISRLYNTRKNKSSMTGPAVNLSGLSNPLLSFKVAAAESVPNHNNFLKVYASSDCGLTWLQLYSKTSPQLVTSNSGAADFIPSGAAEWRQETISLSQLPPSGAVMFKFEYQRDTIASANNIYIDNINILSGIVSVEEQPAGLQHIVLYPVPAKSAVTLGFNNPMAQKIKCVLLDPLGKILELPVEKLYEAGEQLISIDLRAKPPGIYFLRIETNAASVIKKMVLSE